MRYLVIADVHANLEALEAVLRDADGRYDAVIQLGDLVDYGPNPNEVVERVRSLPLEYSLLGNHDLAVLQPDQLALFNPYAQASGAWTARVLDRSAKAYLETLRPLQQHDGFAICHASPRDPVWEYLDDPYSAAENFGDFEGVFCLNGHTHVPRIFTLSRHPERSGATIQRPSDENPLALNDGNRRIVNPGSIGQPRDGDPRAAYALFDSDTLTMEFKRVDYAVDATQRKIVAAGLPTVLAERLSYGM